MDESTVLDYPDLPAERLEYWQKRAFREWAMRPGPDADLPEDAAVRHAHVRLRHRRRPAAPRVDARAFGHGPGRRRPSRTRVITIPVVIWRAHVSGNDRSLERADPEGRAGLPRSFEHPAGV